MKMETYAPGTPNWIDLGVPDPARAATFYGGLFGWTAEEGPPEAGGYRMCLLRGEPVAGLGPQMNPDGPPYWTTYISVTDVAASTARAVELGGAVYVEPMEVMTAGVMSVCADPSGAAFSLWEPRDHQGAALVNEPGTFAWNELLTDDVDGSIAFYTALLGWTAQASAGEMAYTEFQLAGRSIAGLMAKPPDMPPEAPSMWTVYFAVDDADAAVARIAELGGALLMGPMEIEPGRFATVADPDGAVFNVMKLNADLAG